MSAGFSFASLAATVRGADSVAFWFFTIAAVAAAAAGFFHAFRWLQRARLIEDLPTSRVRSASQGYVELEGVAQMLPGPRLNAPLSGLPCVWWSYRIERRNDGRRSGARSWSTVEKAVSDSIFLLADETGGCIVDPDGADVIEATTDCWRGNSVRPAKVMDDVRLSSRSGRYRYTEKRLLSGRQLYALGAFGTRSDAPAWNLGEETRSLLARWKANMPALLSRFDANGDGEIDMEEWQEARRQARGEVESEHRQQAVRPGIHVLSRPVDGRPFLLSTVSQHALANRYRRRSIAGLVAFFVVGGGAAFALTLRFL